MKRLPLILLLVGLLAPPARAADHPEVVLTAYRPGILRVPMMRTYQLKLRARPTCLLGYGYAVPYAAPAAPAVSDPVVVALLTRIADQQQSMSLQMQMLQQAQRPAVADPATLTLLGQLASGQDKVIAAINEGRISDAETKGLLQSMVAGQQQVMLAIQQQAQRPTPPPVVITPPAPVPTPPPVVVVPPSSGGSVVTLPSPGVIQPLPGVGGPLQALPAPGTLQSLPSAGGGLQILPRAGESIQAIPGPAGSVIVQPGGTAPPSGTTPAIPPAGATPSLPGGGNPMTPLPGAGGFIPIVPTQSRLSPPTTNKLVPFRYSLFQTTQQIDPRVLPK